MKRIVMIITNVVFGFIALAAEPTVTDVVAKQRFPWNGLVDITCTVSGIDGTTNGLWFAVEAVDSDKIRNASHYWLVRNGTNSTDYAVKTNGNYRLIWNAQADLGNVLNSNMVVRVTLQVGIQLWEGGPYWATTNIGAEEPWESGYYFWWGDTVGYKRENDAWVATDGSSSTSFGRDNISRQTYKKTLDALVSKGWVVSKDGAYVLAPEHDAAHVHRGGGWRMPTYQELSDLTNNCDWIGTTQNGIDGCEVRGRVDYAASSIFLPCAGFGSETSLLAPDRIGYYWSSVLSSDDDSHSWFVTFSIDTHNTHHAYRYLGFSVRPVHGSTE